MIIDFTVKNFRSFKEEQRLSFVASNYHKELPENLIDPRLPGLDGLKLLKAVGIYGANAAGKTNVLQALMFLGHFVENSATELDEGDETGVEPFLLCPESPGQPSEFALRFVVDGVRYHFALIVDRRRVLYESLSAFPEGVERVWYERSWDEAAEAYEWSPKRPTGFKRDANIVGYTRQNALFLSTAAKWNNEQIAPVYRWFKQRLRFLRLNADFPMLSPGFTADYIAKGANERNRVVSLLKQGDFGVLSVQTRAHEIRREELPEGIPDDLATALMNKKRLEVVLGHVGVDGKEFPLPWEDESSGTQKLFALAGPWLDTLERGYVVGVDEIESSMHPLMVVELLRLVFGPERNRNGGQLVFTTHNPLLLDPSVLRRDQIWFADKDEEGATHLYPLTDYRPRKGESLVRGYLAGRYGAVPFIPDGLLGKEAPHGE
ncbi:MAG: AAA family ATPase [Opitutales bacterium]|nr:AAA family ATPase [Opitutales bacterium]